MDHATHRLDLDARLTLTETQLDRLGLGPGDEVLLETTDNGLLLRPLSPPPGKVYVEPTTRCNLRCPMCVRQYWDEPETDLPWPVFQRLLDGLHELGTCQRMAFWGFGEPLLHPDIHKMISAAHRLGLATELITNGLLLDDSMALGLIQAGLDTIVFSVDGTSLRTLGHPGTASEVAQSIKRIHIIAARTCRDVVRSDGCALVWHEPEIGLEFVATRQNIHELPRVRELGRSVGASFLVVSNLLPYAPGQTDQVLYHKSTGRWTPATHLERRAEVTVGRMDQNVEYLAPLAGALAGASLVDVSANGGGSSSGHCRFVSEGAIAVSADGSISPCVALMHTYTCYILGREKRFLRYAVGNLKDETLPDIWNKPDFVEFRRRVSRFDFPSCSDCGGCDLAATNETDCEGNPFPVCGDCLWGKGIIRCP